MFSSKGSKVVLSSNCSVNIMPLLNVGFMGLCLNHLSTALFYLFYLVDMIYRAIMLLWAVLVDIYHVCNYARSFLWNFVECLVSENFDFFCYNSGMRHDMGNWACKYSSILSFFSHWLASVLMKFSTACSFYVGQMHLWNMHSWISYLWTGCCMFW